MFLEHVVPQDQRQTELPEVGGDRRGLGLQSVALKGLTWGRAAHLDEAGPFAGRGGQVERMLPGICGDK
jgi:hypothetical protein